MKAPTLIETSFKWTFSLEVLVRYLETRGVMVAYTVFHVFHIWLATFLRLNV